MENLNKTFLTVVEIPQHKCSIYVTNETIVVQDFENKSNGIIIPLEKFKENGRKTDDSVSTAESVVETMPDNS